ncbi:hypothetical protein [Pseudomonas aeruginosa]|uniref:hypothetical protein n=1 Tax=Pseudomonas aeruginosa TaxID=287 RepID=UPI000F545784|nr:hypothetical protein [Pseudomonas aeruginosa]RUG42118.1 hypothetical protein IPC760_13035 [Pseudomonas aeruginosa]
MQLNDGDAAFVGSFNKTCMTESGRTLTFGFKAPPGKKFVVLLIGETDKGSDDFDCEAALNRLGFFRREPQP